MIRYIGTIDDANLTPADLFEDSHVFTFATLYDAEGVIRSAGSWISPRSINGGNDKMLLSEPYLRLYKVRDINARTTLERIRHYVREGMTEQADVILETGPRGGIVRVY